MGISSLSSHVWTCRLIRRVVYVVLKFISTDKSLWKSDDAGLISCGAALATRVWGISALSLRDCRLLSFYAAKACAVFEGSVVELLIKLSKLCRSWLWFFICLTKSTSIVFDDWTLLIGWLLGWDYLIPTLKLWIFLLSQPLSKSTYAAL